MINSTITRAIVHTPKDKPIELKMTDAGKQYVTIKTFVPSTVLKDRNSNLKQTHTTGITLTLWEKDAELFMNLNPNSKTRLVFSGELYEETVNYNGTFYNFLKINYPKMHWNAIWDMNKDDQKPITSQLSALKKLDTQSSLLEEELDTQEDISDLPW